MKRLQDYDDHLVANMVSHCREVMKNYPAISKMTALYNLTVGLFRVFSVQGGKKDVIALAEEFSSELVKEVKAMYEADD